MKLEKNGNLEKQFNLNSSSWENSVRYLFPSKHEFVNMAFPACYCKSRIIQNGNSLRMETHRLSLGLRQAKGTFYGELL